MRAVQIPIFLFSLAFTLFTFQTNAMSQTDSKLIYVGDPMCSWCYGFSSELSKAIETLDDQVTVELIMGGLRPYNTETMADLHDFLKEHWEHVAEASGEKFSYGILEDASFVYDTEPPSRAVVVVRKLKPEVEIAFFKSIQKAFYLENQDTHDVNTYMKLAEQFGIDPELFKKEFESEQMKNLVKYDFEAANKMGVRGFPSMVLKKGEEYFLISNGYTKAENIISSVNEILAK